MNYQKLETMLVLWEVEPSRINSAPLITVAHFEDPETREPIASFTPEQVEEFWGFLLELKDECGNNGAICTTASVKSVVGVKSMRAMGFTDRVWTKFSHGETTAATDARRYSEWKQRIKDRTPDERDEEIESLLRNLEELERMEEDWDDV